ncbi:hypothetical protein FDN13_01250 [Caloramator sp. E03]|uniref:vitamin B12 dependent-methionine synthase activation domain-containing protein n=1 Tax=Caloramator sp. E03 TaxID=2576307 RepID=UPI001110CA6F|nr:vitamin B12 dependent-methionine synthase activation domain-containing protein [Caloramator sp. E03]QCX32433.1 hypothetical protein FDN13_01250 [Caloramator sp. E03]
MCAFLAATLGSNIDNKIKYYEKTDFTRSIILDACATTAIEELCDMVEEEIKAIALEKYKKNITNRYSPGYGDLSLEYQPSIINLLDANKRIGLTVTDSLILIPRKSVTAIIGFQDDYIIKESSKCNKCKNNSNCFYRKGENYCEKQDT